MDKRKYDEEHLLETRHEEILAQELKNAYPLLRRPVFSKVIALLRCIPLWAKLHFDSLENKKLQKEEERTPKKHPVRPIRGQIFNAEIGENIGSELSGNHLVIIIQNSKGNIYSEKVNVVPIEGDGNKIKPSVHLKLTNEDLEFGHLDKDPSRVIFADIMTIDKARLGRRIGQIKSVKLEEICNKIKEQLEL
ncbi:type II toxin-antitoxin system PemK/MazF family toxin [Paenibacillus chartarius]|uniref:Type II toxin-antitoxin system PemK/MazF family toxin n=1 Tax=Paenibacillus chartarius TaxID=747481 RepID=A0ABV6DHQ6_9BACL